MEVLSTGNNYVPSAKVGLPSDGGADLDDIWINEEGGEKHMSFERKGVLP